MQESKKIPVTIVTGFLGDHIFEKYIEAKEEEWDSYRTKITQWEIDEYLTKY